MIPVYILGDKNDRQTCKNICKLLENRLKLCCISFGSVYGDISKSDLVVIETTAADEIHNGIVIFKPQTGSAYCGNIKNACTAVLQSDNAGAKRILSGKSCNIIACGMSVRNTLSISARSEKRCSVSLQRSIIAANGEIQEECEIVLENNLQNSLCTDYEQMSAAAVLLYCGAMSR